jgi:hypothetical protein
MSDMADRVAKAIADYWLAHGFDPGEPDNEVARVVIMAMREPIIEMLIASHYAQTWHWETGAQRDTQVWHSMIDAALAE